MIGLNFVRLQVKKVADSLHLDNSPKFGEEWYQILCEVSEAEFTEMLTKFGLILAMHRLRFTQHNLYHTRNISLVTSEYPFLVF